MSTYMLYWCMKCGCQWKSSHNACSCSPSCWLEYELEDPEIWGALPLDSKVSDMDKENMLFDALSRPPASEDPERKLAEMALGGELVYAIEVFHSAIITRGMHVQDEGERGRLGVICSGVALALDTSDETVRDIAAEVVSAALRHQPEEARVLNDRLREAVEASGVLLEKEEGTDNA